LVPALLFFGGVFLISATILTFPRWTLALLCGRGWWNLPGVALQKSARKRHVNREQRGRRHRRRGYPQGVPAKYKKDADSALPTDVALEPTRLGNVFAAAQHRILLRHGLWMASCQWLLLEIMPAEKRSALEALSDAVLRRVHAWEWLILTASWACFLPGTAAKVIWVAVCLLAAHWAYREICRASADYCDVLEAIVLTHRPALYRAVGFPVPKSTDDEPRKGLELSGYLDQRERVSIPLRWPEYGGDGKLENFW
jgi:hypothetical protein